MRKILFALAAMLASVPSAHAQDVRYWPSYQYDLPNLGRPYPTPFPPIEQPRRFGPSDVRRVELKSQTFACPNKLLLEQAISLNDRGFKRAEDRDNYLEFLNKRCYLLDAVELHGRSGSICAGYPLDERYGEVVWFQCSRIIK